MNSMCKAIWYIESHFGSALSFSGVAKVAGMSKFHLVRAFGIHSGQSVMRYVRARRLSEAAKRLIGGNDGILDVALEAGYNSHEAFTRAFGAQFGITPDQLRKARALENIQLVAPLRMNEEMTDLSEPRIVEGDALLIIGLKKPYNDETSAKMPSQWHAFQPYIGNIENQQEDAAFGVLCNSDDHGNVEYMTGVAVSRYPNTMHGFDSLRLSPQTYAVFTHVGHVSDIRRTWKIIFGKWLPASGMQLVDAPQLERYDARFDRDAGTGDIEIWIPVRTPSK